MSLPASSVHEILEKAVARRRDAPKASSPKGVADLVHAPFSVARKGSSSLALKPVSILAGFPHQLAASQALGACSAQFLGDVLTLAHTFMQYDGRLIIHSWDIAAALDVFPKAMDVEGSWYQLHPLVPATADAEAGIGDGKGGDDDGDDEDEEEEEWQGEGEDAAADEDSADEDFMSEAIAVDEERAEDYDEPYSEDEEHGDAFNLHAASAAAFDAVYPPVEDILHLSDARFREELLTPVVLAGHGSRPPFAIGDDAKATYFDDARARINEEGIENCHSVGLLKKALYAFLTTKLSSA